MNYLERLTAHRKIWIAIFMGIIALACIFVAIPYAYASSSNQIPNASLNDVQIAERAERAKIRIANAVEQGKRTQAQADEKIAGQQDRTSKGMFNKGSCKFRTNPEQVKIRIATAVEEGKLTQDEADERLAKLQERIDNGNLGKGPRKFGRKG